MDRVEGKYYTMEFDNVKKLVEVFNIAKVPKESIVQIFYVPGIKPIKVVTKSRDKWKHC